MQNLNQSLAIPPKIKLDELKNLFFQLSVKSCNLKCKNCYIVKNPYKNEDDFISLEKIKQTLFFIKNEKSKLNSIYLTGGEPLLHPDFNQILRMSLKISNVTVLTNGTLINDKKARFLKKIDDESSYETIYRVSLDSIDEIENDNLRGRGTFRKALSAINSLIKYEFNPIITVINYKNKEKSEIFAEFSDFFAKKGIEIEDINLKIIPYFPKNFEIFDVYENQYDNFLPDCKTSRVVSQTGIYSCPMLVEDYRARLGSSLDDSSENNYLDCEKCLICLKNNQKIQINDWC